ncbi:NADH-quinone oxidoreductase subunit A [Hoyosella sp. G463]|uniref:NADH-quinone oxidoreductase subunit A n=1 Tax=Lolliginicoccus lacisalsi TaxID=2742202 RepID=A0A927PMB9_9ACTN|nr:NADH-quinone oxidoreductase subunit A [Lolliginicoccus lacisalsi]MBD8506211.1 NADH-quinone oxidoreductase subunit A [Lolliginicoccus lacisalsi]
MGTLVPILVLGAIAAAFALVSAAMGSLLGPSRRNQAKLEAYECGIEPVPPPAMPGRGRFSVKYYLTAMLFIIFGVEIVFLYPWAVHFDELGLFGLAAMGLFLVNVSVAYVYEWRRGGLSWD